MSTLNEFPRANDDHSAPKIPSAFSLPTESTGRFRMLAVLALVAVWSLPASIVVVPPVPTGSEIVPEDVRAIGLRFVQGEAPSLRIEDFLGLLEWAQEIGLLNIISLHLLRLALSVSLIVVVVTSAEAFARSRLRVALRSTSQTESNDDETNGPLREVRSMARKFAQRELPVHLKQGFIDGMIVGEQAAERLVLSGSPRQLRRSWSDSHRAVVLHEIGHLVNNDSDLRDWSRGLLRSLSWAYLLLLPLALMANRRLPERGLLDAVATLALAWAIWAHLVRGRELEADLRVVEWGYGGALQQRLSLLEAYRPPPAPRSTVSRIGRIFKTVAAHVPWKYHPSNELRRRSAAEPRSFFGVSPTLAIYSGMWAAFLGSRIAPSSPDLRWLVTVGVLPFVGSPNVANMFFVVVGLVLLLLFTLCTYLIARVVGIQVLRAALWRFTMGEHQSVRLFQAAGLLAVGLEVGLWLFLGMWPRSLKEVAWILAWLATMASLLWIWLAATFWLGGFTLSLHRGPDPPRRKVTLFLWIQAILLALLAWPLVVARGFVATSTTDALARVLGTVGTHESLRVHSLVYLLAYWKAGAGLAVGLVLVLLMTLLVGYLWPRMFSRGRSAVGDRSAGGAIRIRLGAPWLWAVDVSNTEPGRHGQRGSASLVARAICILGGVGAAGWLGLALLAVAIEHVPGFGWSFGARSAATEASLHNLTLAFLFVPAGCVLMACHIGYRFIKSRRDRRRALWTGSLKVAVGSMRDWLASEKKRIGHDLAEDESPIPRGRNSPESFLATAARSVPSALHRVTRMLTFCAACCLTVGMGGLSLLMFALALLAGVSSALSSEGGGLSPITRFIIAGSFFGWPSVVLLIGAALCAATVLDLWRWYQYSSSQAQSARRELARLAHGRLGAPDLSSAETRLLEQFTRLEPNVLTEPRKERTRAIAKNP